MTKVNIFSRVLAALLCVGVVLTSCEGDDPLGEENTELGSGENSGDGENGGTETQPDEGDKEEPVGLLTGSLEKVNWNSAAFTGRLAVPSADIAPSPAQKKSANSAVRDGGLWSA